MSPDIFGDALAHPGTGPLLVERSDGHTSTTDLGWWLHQYEARHPGDLAALDWAGPGTAEDIGCCTGRHLKHLATRGISAHGIDTCEAAVTRAREAGNSADVADAHTYTPPQPVDTVIALGGGPGIAGTLKAVPAFLGRLTSWLAPGGQLIVSSVDWTATADHDAHRAWVEKATSNGRYPGDIRLRLRHGEQTGDWFDWVWLDPDTLETTAGQAGLRVAEVRRFGPAWYAATLRRTAP
ncbi:class I SAM-dependent methyltransferase [Streptomyces sp. NPDC058247]|uniref:class I SAM-dependent methyltransferase n=1 Tax=Streptomyces sp. NPDC058247 TaxID=3346401 RepID=UPI0036E297B4